MSAAALSPCLVDTPSGVLEYAAFGHGPPMLCLHGAMGGFDQSALLGRLLAPAGWRCLAVSRPGSLGSPLAGRETPEAQADACAGLLAGLNTSPAVVMAVSGGGPCALHLALRHPALCRGLVLVSTCSGRIEQRLPLAYHMLRLLGRFPWLAGALRPRGKGGAGASLARAFHDPAARAAVAADPEALALFLELTAGTASRLAERLPGTVNDVAVTRTREYPLERLGVATLVIHGTADPHVPFAAHGARLAARIPGARLLAVPGGEHACIFSHRAQARQAVAAFLAELPQA
jgi:pimeloyl-ACP methyl ester carboxylesterase